VEAGVTPRDYALLAQEAYTAAPDIGKADSASRAIVRQTAAGLCVAFPGTDNLDCITTDLNAVPIDVREVGRVHRGFWQAWQEIAKPVLDAIGDQPVTLVGHSLGAALAICAAVSLTLAGKPPLAVWAFEPPRVSPDISVRTMLSGVPLHLYRNGNDVVPTVPLGWSHAGMLTNIGKAAYPWPNVADHAISRVIDTLSAIGD
jgi:triacylglycerol lipase